MPPFWRNLLGGSSSSSSSSTAAVNAEYKNSNNNNNTAIPSSSSSSSSIPSSTSTSTSTPRHHKQQQHSNGSSHSLKASTTTKSKQNSNGNGNSNTTTTAPIVIPSTSSSTSKNGSHSYSTANPTATTTTTSTSVLSGASSSSYNQDDADGDALTDDGSIPDTPYSSGHSPSHARHRFPGPDANDNGRDSIILDGSANSNPAKAIIDESDASPSDDEATFASNGPPASTRPHPDIPTTHTILANPLPQPSSGLAAAISSVLPSSASSLSSSSSSYPANSNTSPASAFTPLSNIKSASGGGNISTTGGNPSQDSTSPRTFDIDDMISRLLESGYSGKIPKHVSLKNAEITALCLAAREVFLSQPTLLELSPPVNIVGDVHGQYSDLIRLFEMCGFPPKANYLFLGDYVDRGKQSLETILLLLCYKVKYPENFFLLRGNHECANVTRVYGFYDECKRRCNIKIWKTFVDVFNCLPIAALVAGKIFCVHGGLSPSLSSMDDIRRISRPTDVPDYGLLNDLLWSDPSDTALDWEDNERGVSYCFGKAVIQDFLAKYDFDLICRAHMVVEDGYEFWNDRTLVTIFSAPNYCGEFDNFASSMLVNEELLCSFELLKPLDGPALKKELAKCRKKNSAGLLPRAVAL